MQLELSERAREAAEREPFITDPAADVECAGDTRMEDEQRSSIADPTLPLERSHGAGDAAGGPASCKTGGAASGGAEGATGAVCVKGKMSSWK